MQDLSVVHERFRRARQLSFERKAEKKRRRRKGQRGGEHSEPMGEHSGECAPATLALAPATSTSAVASSSSSDGRTGLDDGLADEDPMGHLMGHSMGHSMGHGSGAREAVRDPGYAAVDPVNPAHGEAESRHTTWGHASRGHGWPFSLSRSASATAHSLHVPTQPAGQAVCRPQQDALLLAAGSTGVAPTSPDPSAAAAASSPVVAAAAAAASGGGRMVSRCRLPARSARPCSRSSCACLAKGEGQG